MHLKKSLQIPKSYSNVAMAGTYNFMEFMDTWGN